ncbi:MAG: dienelactone hydrolase family protein [Chloroflexota bacterium]|nr:dienelactone hydrolase family protein [Chloroflexota bacterium]
MIELGKDETAERGYLAIPESGRGPGVLVLHAWWGLTPFFQGLCDRLAGEGFVALAPDLYGGPTAATIDDAQRLMEKQESDQMHRRATIAVEHLGQHSAVVGDELGVVGVSMGAAWAVTLSTETPDAIAAVVLFYGTYGGNFDVARASYLGHFAELDEWEPLEGVRGMEADMKAAGRDVRIHLYPEAGHWFFEDDRPKHYHPESATAAWERSIHFLRGRLAPLRDD